MKTRFILISIIIATSIVASFVTFIIPSIRMSHVSTSFMNFLDPEYVAYHHHIDPSTSSSISFEDFITKPDKISAANKFILPECRVMFSQPQYTTKKKNINNNKKSIIQPRSVFRIVLFTDMHFGEDGHLDLLTQEFQRKVLFSTPSKDYYDLVVVMGDSISQADYAPLRPSSSSSKRKTEEEEQDQQQSSLYSIPSCLRDEKLGAKRCSRMAHRAILESGIPFLTLVGNHPHPPTNYNDNEKHDSSKVSHVPVQELINDLHEHQRDLFSFHQHEFQKFSDSSSQNNDNNNNNNNNNNQRKGHLEEENNNFDHIVCSPSTINPEMCTLTVHDAPQTEEEKQKEETPKQVFNRNLKPNERPSCYSQKSKPSVALSFFNSVSDETDTFLLHGYKYPSQQQLSYGRKFSHFIYNGIEQMKEDYDLRLLLPQQQQQNDKTKKNKNRKHKNKNKTKESIPLQIAFVHVPPPIYLSRASIVASAGYMNETPGCSPKDLSGPVEFSRLLIEGELGSSSEKHRKKHHHEKKDEASAGGGVDITICGHDHKNSEYAVHDRRRVSWSQGLVGSKNILEKFTKSHQSFAAAAAAHHNNKYHRRFRKHNNNKEILKNNDDDSDDDEFFLAHQREENFHRPLHLVYSKNSGFGGYYQQQISESRKVPGARIVEILEYDPENTGYIRNSNSHQSEEEARCNSLKQQFISDDDVENNGGTDVKLCRFFKKHDDDDDDAVVGEEDHHHHESDDENELKKLKQDAQNPILDYDEQQQHRRNMKKEDFTGGVFQVVRSYVLEAEIGLKNRNKMMNSLQQQQNINDNNNELRQQKIEEAIKAREPEERLLHSKFKHMSIVGLKKDVQELKSPKFLLKNKNKNEFLVEILEECDAEVDYRSQFRIILIILWMIPFFILLFISFVLIIKNRKVLFSSSMKKSSSHVV